jgi:hypothetical protein
MINIGWRTAGCVCEDEITKKTMARLHEMQNGLFIEIEDASY